MADDLTRPFIGYRSAGRRPESQQDRRAAADAPLSALRGAVSGVLGAPGDIESLIRMLPGLSEQTVLPTSEDVEKRLPMRELNQTPTGKAFTTAGQLGGGFYTGPGSPLRAVAALPSAVSRAGRDFLMAGSPVNVVKPKGGNWLAGSVERAIEPMQKRVTQAAEQNFNPAQGMTFREIYSQDALNKWLETKLAKYIRNEMATPEDPLRALAERGIMHSEITPTGYNVARARQQAGFPEEGMGVSPMAKAWEDRADTFINELKASDLTSGYPESIEANPWLLKVPPETRVYDMLRGADEDLGFAHLTDELRNAINPESGLPREMMLKYSDLEKVTVPQAVERVAKINDWRAAQKAEADMARAMGPATQVVKEYPEQGFKWVELRQPKETGKKVTVEKSEMELPDDMTPEMMREVAEDMALDEMLEPGTRAFNDHVEGLMADFNRKKKVEMDESYKALEDALKYEGETMGHCVGGYCPDVSEGRSKIYSLRDKKGQPHVTIEVKPPSVNMPREEMVSARDMSPEEFQRAADEMGSHYATLRDAKEKGWLYHPRVPYWIDQASLNPSIVQIKGKGNKAPKEDYLPAVQDFVRSGNFGKVGDLQNTGLVKFGNEYRTPSELLYKTDEGDWINLADAAKQYFPDNPAKQQNFMQGAVDPSLIGSYIKLADQPEGFARGGAVHGYQAGGAARTLPELHQRYAEGGAVTGANFPTDDYDPARIDAIVAGLQAEMQS
jgi:hypothetical protein